MSVAFSSLSQAQKDQITNFVDKVLRPVVLQLARAMVKTDTSLVPQYLVSPTGLASTMGSPAADSVAGLLATLTAGEVIPIVTSALDLEGPLLASKAAAYVSSLNGLLATLYTAAVRQDYAQIVGAVNLIP